MKRLLYALLIAALCLPLSCGKEPDPQNNDDQPTDQPGDNPGGNTQEEEPVPVVVTEPYLVTSEIMMKFIENVTYDERDYSYTHVMDPEYAPYGAPGDADMPPKVPISWEAPEGEVPLTLYINDGEWAYDLFLSPGVNSYELTNLVPNRDYSWTVTRDDTGKTWAFNGTLKRSMNDTKALLKDAILKKGYKFKFEIPIDEKGEKQVLLTFEKNKDTLLVMVWNHDGGETYFSYGITQ